MMAKRIAATTANRLRRRIFSVSFWTRGMIISVSVYRLAACRFEEHLLQRLRAALGVEDVDSGLDERRNQRWRIRFLDGDPDAVRVGAEGEVVLRRDGAGAGDIVDAQFHLTAAGDEFADVPFAEDAAFVDDGHA